MKNTLAKIQYEEKKSIDNIFINELVNENRKKLETEEYKDILVDILNIDDKNFIQSFKDFWKFHNKFNNDFIDKIISDNYELSPSDLNLILETLKFSNQIDYEWLALSWGLKQKAEYLISKLKNIYNRNSINSTPTKWSYFIRYKRHHLLYLYALKTKNPHLFMIKKSIINQYHSWDEQLFDIRLNRDFGDFLGVNADVLNEEIKKLENHPKKTEWIDEKNLNEVLTFDNLIEYQYISQLQWLPALKLNHMAKEIIKKEHMDLENIEDSLWKIIEKKNLKFNNHVNWYKQTGLTCSAASLLMALNHFNWTELSKDIEDEIANKSASEFIPWQHYSWVWLYSLNMWLKTKLIHSDINFFQNPWMPKWLFEYLMHEYWKYYNEFIEKWGITDFNDISNDDIVSELKKWYLILLAWEHWDLLHTKLITWYDIPKKMFNVIDPLEWNETTETFDSIQKFCTTQLWKWMLAVKKTNFKDWDCKDTEEYDILNKYKQEFSEFKESVHKKEDVVNLDEVMFYDYQKFWSKWYNLSILKNNWLNVSDWVTLTPKCVNEIKQWYFDKDKKRVRILVEKIESILWPWPYIVRSNFVWEDWWNKSYAWCFESYLNVDSNSLFESIKNVLNSWRVNDLILDWWVLIQKMIYWSNSWVAFVNEDINIDVTEWLNDKLVSWEITPENIRIKADWNVEWNITYLSKENLDELHNSLFKIKKIFNKWMDVEFSLKDWKLYILQARPITTNLDFSVDSFRLQSNIWSFDAFLISKWDIEWKIKIIKNSKDVDDIKEECVVICSQLFPDLIKKAHKIKWIISEKWWQLAHLSIVGREMWIPIISWCKWIIPMCDDKNEVIYKNDFMLFK